MKKNKKTKSAKSPTETGGFSSFITHLGEEWKPLIESHNTILHFSKDDLIFSEGQPVEGMHCINHGKVKVFSFDPPDGEHILRLAKDGDIVGLRGIGPELKYPVSARALTDCTISFLSIEVFMSLLRTNSSFCYYFMNLIAAELRKSETQMRTIARMEMKERMAMAIIRNLEAFGYDPDDSGLLAFTLSRRDFSSIAGTTYETVIRMLSELEKRKLIRLERKHIRILNEPGLRKLVKN